MCGCLWPVVIDSAECSGVCEKGAVCDKLRCEDGSWKCGFSKSTGEMLAHPHEPYIQMPIPLCGFFDHEVTFSEP